MKPTSPDSHFHPHKANMVPFAVSRIVEESVTDFDLYLEVADHLTLYAKAPYRWGAEELRRLRDTGRNFFYHSTADQEKALIYQAVNHVSQIDENETSGVKLIKITDAAADLNRVLYQHPTQITASALEKVRDLASHMVQTIEQDPHCVAVLGKLARHDDYTYYHSARVSAYALAIAIQLSQHSKAQLLELATGALLHDIGKSSIDLQILNKPGILTPAEWEQMKKHPLFGQEQVKESSLSHAARQIILSHHERFDGSGYPHHLMERELLEEVKIVAFADTFDALTTNRPYQQSRTAFEALDLIRHKLLKNLHRDSYEALVQLIGSRPLENDSEEVDS